jgi:hyperosmotically inducible periplasmic protein
MKGMSKVKLHLWMIVLLIGSCPLLGQERGKSDNTRVNKRDRSDEQVTADQQKQNSSDLELTRKIRRSITKDKSLSTYAHNVKIIAQNGTVTLKGPVRSEAESKAIELKAAEVAGASNVKNELDGAAEKQPSNAKKKTKIE